MLGHIPHKGYFIFNAVLNWIRMGV